ncbi:MAG: hypothetical protein E5W56_01845 [Mesorhizobium sp.]|nr:hypothetical protein EN874_030875 [Mesorhizobium sp. M1D.F.Ca.ET.231.01.1.1]TGP25370.1 hypothetical protein EN877_30135 [Mesorhizobium sp. M1D.F.Ca.ET.234.01.1.1]TGS37836.1 hypothetical protein EN827_30435 [Mesorhizobium sp. M1D.F.Ca.ET.184.01.1.1]TGS58189.1 hypothetical protein EN826_030410 [Mesorhizobium sp. M1D.F.Ca.ET.183.01.1.1]TIT80710.1 MAG: hypothetical protein E5W57_01495 [Mesorhizobium sp.]
MTSKRGGGYAASPDRLNSKFSRAPLIAKEPAIRAPSGEVHAGRYDNDCQDALASRLDDLLDQAQAAGWNRIRAASALMYLAARRLRGA